MKPGVVAVLAGRKTSGSSVRRRSPYEMTKVLAYRARASRTAATSAVSPRAVVKE